MNKYANEKIAKPESKKKEWFLIGAVLLVTFILFSPALKNDFTNWDDDLYVTKNKVIRSLGFDTLGEFGNNFVGNFQPLTMISYATDYHFFGLDPFYFHLKNIVYHLLNTILVFFLIKRISGGNLFISIFTALIFGIHPMHVESVAWVAERKDVLYTFYFLAGLLFYYQYLIKKKILYLGAAALSFILSAFSKSAAVIFPAVLVLIDYYEGRKYNIKTISEKIPFFIFSLLIGLVALKTQSESNTIVDLQVTSIFEKTRFAAYGFMNYLVKFIFPHHLSAFHSFPDKSNIPEVYNLSLIAILLIVGYFAFHGRKRRWLVFGAVFYFITIALVLQFITVGGAITAERYTYVPYIGIGLIYATWANRILNKSVNQTMKYFLGIFLVIQLIYYSGVTYSRTKVWKDSGTLWTDVIEKYPKESRAYIFRGNFYHSQKNNKQALNDYDKAIQISNKNYRTYAYRAKTLFEIGQTDNALADYNKSIALNGNIADNLSNRGSIYAIKKDYDKSLADFNKALEIEPENLKALSNRGLLFFELGEVQKTIDDYRRYLQIKPNNPDIIYTIGLSYSRMADYKRALDEYNQAIRIDSTKGEYFYNRSITFNVLGESTNALKDELRAQQLGFKINPDYADSLKVNE